jgi:hypothetical protein
MQKTWFITGFQGTVVHAAERQRRSIIQPRVARTRYPGIPREETPNPEGVVASGPSPVDCPFGCNPYRVVSSRLLPRVAPPAQPWADGSERRWRSPEISKDPTIFPIIHGVFGLALTLALSCALPLLAAEPAKPAQTKSTQDSEAAYTRTIEKRVGDILAVLDLSDTAKSAKAHDFLIAQYRALRDWHDANDAKLKQANPDQAGQIKATLKPLHDKFLANLSAVLTPAQLERVKDQMTYNKVKVTYDAYCEIVPNLTEAQKTRMLELLREAREEAMDGGSAEEKSAVFKKYKGKINNYLSAEGHDVKQAYKDWGEKQKQAKPEIRNPKAEGNPKPEIRKDSRQ